MGGERFACCRPASGPHSGHANKQLEQNR